LAGREFDLVTYRHNWGENRVYFHDDDGAVLATRLIQVGRPAAVPVFYAAHR